MSSAAMSWRKKCCEREEHPIATLQEIEEEVDKRLARWRAGLVEGIAMASAAVEVGSRAAE
jgi:hypothetical protein